MHYFRLLLSKPEGQKRVNLIRGGHCLAQFVLARKIVGVVGGVGGLQMLWYRRGLVAGGSGLEVHIYLSLDSK